MLTVGYFLDLTSTLGPSVTEIEDLDGILVDHI